MEVFMNNVKKLVICGLMAAVTTAATMFLSMPIPGVTGAYINAGDAAVYISAYLLGGPLGAACAGVGSALADLLLGSALYAPATLIIKAGMGLLAGALMSRLKGWKSIFALLSAGVIMVAGYFGYECILYGTAAALLSIPMNLIQYAGGVLIGFICIQAIRRVKKEL